MSLRIPLIGGARSRASEMRGFLRADGRKGIRNYLVVAYLVECAHHVARKIAAPFEDDGAQLIGFPGCYPSDYAAPRHEAICHASQCRRGAAGLARLRGVPAQRAEGRRRSERPPGRTAAIQSMWRHRGNDRHAAAPGSRSGCRSCSRADRADSISATWSSAPNAAAPTGLSGITINPAVGRAVDRLVDAGATVMFEETCELIGCEEHMAGRAVSPELGAELIAAVAQGRQLLSRPRPRKFRRRQHQVRPLDARGKIARRLCQERHAADQRRC